MIDCFGQGFVEIRKLCVNRGTHQKPSESLSKGNFPRLHPNPGESAALWLCPSPLAPMHLWKDEDIEYEVWNHTSAHPEKAQFSQRLIGHSSIFIFLIVFLKFLIAFLKGFFIYSDNNFLSAICRTHNVLRL